MILEQLALSKKEVKSYSKVNAFFSLVEKYFLFANCSTIIDLCCGNGMLGFYCLERNPELFVYFVDIRKTNNFTKLATKTNANNFEFIEESIYNLKDVPGETLLSIHACNQLTDQAIKLSLDGDKSFAVMPCCYSKELVAYYKENLPVYLLRILGLAGYVDLGRVKYVRSKMRECTLESIDKKISPMNNVIVSNIA